ncbi:MAG: hypothetical protein IK066_03995, partial [Kiritimatiellae bacterium]|nr:hypothetical protein [Kiritimatiellia bacterium]
LSLSAGLNTTFYKTLHSQTAASFSEQLKNNMGEYFGATVSIPLFNRLSPWTLAPDLPSAATALLSLARPSDILLLVGAGSIDSLLPLLLSRLSS